MKISVSALELYAKCPRAYKLHALDEVLPQRKTLSTCKSAAAKKVISALHREKKQLSEFSPEDIENLCERIWQEETSDPQTDWTELNAIATQSKPATRNKEAVAETTKGQKSLAEIKTWCIEYCRMENEAQIVYSDVFFEDKIGDVIFYGSLDQVRQSQEGLQLAMFRTSSQIPSSVYLTRDFGISLAVHAVWQGVLFQGCQKISLKTIPAAYCYYLPNLEQYQKTGKKNKKGELKGDPMIPVHRSQKTLLDFEYEVLELVEGMRMRHFPMRVVNPCGCSLCQYAHQCKSGVAQPVIPEYAEIVE